MTGIARHAVAVLALALCAVPASAASAARAAKGKIEPLLTITRPTVVAFAKPVGDAQMKKDPGAGEAMGDYGWYRREIVAWCEKAGLAFEDAQGPRFRWQAGAEKPKAFRPPPGGDLGYVLFEPGRDPQILVGVRTGVDFPLAACKYFKTTPRLEQACQDVRP